MSNNKLGFWAVFALVTGSQIGTGILILPTNLAPFGFLSVVSWAFSIIGVLSLAMVFANLCRYFPETGGPHIYVERIFGRNAAFFIGWTYWLVSWISSTAVVIEAMGYLLPLIEINNQFICLGLEILLLLIITGLNFRGVQAAGAAELILVALKILPLIIVPIGALFYFNLDNFVIDNSVKDDSNSTNCAKIVLLTIWGFVGLESATTAAGSVSNPGKIIPRAVIAGTLAVAFLYFTNVLSIMGLIKGSDLMHSRSPYVDAARHVFGGQWHLLISIISSIVCIGTLNAWTLVSGQIALGLAESSFLPKIFAKKNVNGAPVFAITISTIGIIILLILTANKSMVQQVTAMINFSTTSFLFVYLVCAVGLLKFLLTKSEHRSLFKLFTAIVAVIFSLWVIYETPITTLMIASLFTFSGIPLYLSWYSNGKVTEFSSDKI
ncbi:Amino acid permease [Candidatus Trichorickettsia mobilis]|uniref:Arginine/agmatine antiporter n=1 Tax=Candidatus Trichorickettsia mobilis TaxID=1346319 RepID=A0ABZ0UT84_9RICK|nr:amino acid permease [Candidatus Trichorickettsia mobilis]WPY01248.1 Amino acid permease [Candidatus Trichorickettsia mobilis]